MVLLPHNLHAQVGRLEGDIPLRSLQVGSNRQGVYNSPAGTSYTAEKRINNTKTKVMTKKEQASIDYANENNDLTCGECASDIDLCKCKKVKAQMKFRMPNGTDRYVTKTFNDVEHMNAYIDKVCKQANCDLDEVWYGECP
tara:strand:+ start:7617 stop:8039 length:423 start_codon:yes stop_codon:yes gene_type:complete